MGADPVTLALIATALTTVYTVDQSNQQQRRASTAANRQRAEQNDLIQQQKDRKKQEDAVAAGQAKQRADLIKSNQSNIGDSKNGTVATSPLGVVNSGPQLTRTLGT